ncbi:hypothetical protein MU1_04730 [Paenibacillus glycanilyticus]|uniref:Uncharacterized protein n=1 Tax=Paenibacillus glycanilyticus TaxID=126569 RepID=A0ABQ6G588_9BACL|nr:hypothetical protein MU1_04730 [Paenibacillus glycanilyticus]
MTQINRTWDLKIADAHGCGILKKTDTYPKRPAIVESEGSAYDVGRRQGNGNREGNIRANESNDGR